MASLVGTPEQAFLPSVTTSRISCGCCPDRKHAAKDMRAVVVRQKQLTSGVFVIELQHGGVDSPGENSDYAHRTGFLRAILADLGF